MAEAKRVDALTTFGLPFFFLILMFMSVMTSGQHLLNAIIEEKMSKISEVLLGSVMPFQLLMGKLLGVVAVALTLTLVYFAGGTYMLVSAGRLDIVNPMLMVWFVVFVICASLMFGSIFLALGSACSDLKDAQSMLQPAMILVMLAYLGSFIVIRAPESSLAVGMSFFPTITPFAMMLRIAMPPGPPMWQVLLSVAILLLVTAAIVWAAGRIFRVGLLMQGKAPNLPELMKWIRVAQAQGPAHGRLTLTSSSPAPGRPAPRRRVRWRGRVLDAPRRQGGVPAQQAVRRRRQRARADAVSVARGRARGHRRAPHRHAASGRPRAARRSI